MSAVQEYNSSQVQRYLYKGTKLQILLSHLQYFILIYNEQKFLKICLNTYCTLYDKSSNVNVEDEFVHYELIILNDIFTNLVSK